MSGGEYNYISRRLLTECEGRMFDSDLDELVLDFAAVLHALEWWQSGDHREEEYRKIAKVFKAKWLRRGGGEE